MCLCPKIQFCIGTPETTAALHTNKADAQLLEEETELQQCPLTTCSSAEDNSPDKPMALVPYNEEMIPVLYKPQRQFSFLGHTLSIVQDWVHHGVAAVVWDAAIVLSEYLTHHQNVVRGRHVLELGAGTGLVGMVAALAGGEVTSTERAEALEHLKTTVATNMNPTGYQVRVMELDWTHNHMQVDFHPDVILGADIIYIEETFADLLRTLLYFTDFDTHVLLSCKIRYQRDSRFLSMLKEYFEISKVHFDSERDIHIYSAKRRVS